MRALTQRRFRNSLHRLMLCSLLIAIPVYGTAATLVELLGVRHIHALSAAAGASADPMAGWGDLRRGGFKPLPLRPLHHHAASERHHHGVDDVTVVALDGGFQSGDADSGGAAAGSLAQVFTLSSPGSFAVPTRVDRFAVEAASLPASQWIAGGLERPPKT